VAGERQRSDGWAYGEGLLVVYEVINTDRVIEHLNFMAEVELALIDAFEGAVLATSERSVRTTLEGYREVTQHHWALTAMLINRYGSIPQPKETLLSLFGDIEADLARAPTKVRRLRRFQGLSILVALAKSNWEVLRRVLEAAGEQPLAVRAAEVAQEKNTQLEWLRSDVARLGLRSLVSCPLASRRLTRPR